MTVLDIIAEVRAERQAETPAEVAARCTRCSNALWNYGNCSECQAKADAKAKADR